MTRILTYPNTHSTKLKAALSNTITDMILSQIPTRTICVILIWPLEKTMAFGGVETGIIKAQLAAIVTGIESNKGLILVPTAIVITMGMNIVARATLLISSVINSMVAIRIRKIKRIEKLF